MKKTFCFIILLVCSACSLPLDFSPSRQVLFQLTDGIESTRENASELIYPQSATRLLVREARADSLINSRKILFSDSHEVGFYQFANWAESPSKRLTELLVEKFLNAKAFKSVSRLGSGSLGDVQLNLELLKFVHNVSERPGTADIVVRFELVDIKRRELIDSKVFSRSQAVSSYDSEGAVKSFSLALSALLDESLLWTTSLLSSKQSQ